MMKTIFNGLSFLFLITACSGEDDPIEPTTTTATAETGKPAPVTGDNEWAQLCGSDLPDCPADQNCFMAPVPDGSTTQGYCSPSCQVDADCTDGFVGPGTALCFNPPNCLIDCLMAYGDNQCPEGLTCLPTGGPTNACGVRAE